MTLQTQKDKGREYVFRMSESGLEDDLIRLQLVQVRRHLQLPEIDHRHGRPRVIAVPRNQYSRSLEIH